MAMQVHIHWRQASRSLHSQCFGVLRLLQFPMSISNKLGPPSSKLTLHSSLLFFPWDPLHFPHRAMLMIFPLHHSTVSRQILSPLYSHPTSILFPISSECHDGTRLDVTSPPFGCHIVPCQKTPVPVFGDSRNIPFSQMGLKWTSCSFGYVWYFVKVNFYKHTAASWRDFGTFHTA